MANETEKAAERTPASPSESGPLRGGRPVDPASRNKDRHPTAEAEDRCENVREGGHPDEGGGNRKD